MAVFKCKMCGGDLNIAETDKVVECEYCGTTQTVPTADNEKKMTLFNRANRLRLNNEFDKAAALYEQLVSEFPEEAEAYWGLCLCNWGIEYVDDPATGEKKPTCHRASFESLVKDENYALAMEYADVIAQRVYRREAQEIDRINDAILSVSRNEKPYDVFICYKETDESGTRTHDSVLAQDIYEALTAKGLKVFFSRITLEDKLGRQYEPYIFAALNSAKVMLAVGTKYEHFHAVWVKNEWSRFLRLAAKDRNKVLIPCFRDMDPYDLPDEFKGLQAQDLGKLGAVQDLVRGVEKLLAKDAPTKQEAPQAVVSNPAAASVQSFLKRAFMFLEDGDWSSANDYAEKVLDLEPENAMAYVAKLMSEQNVKRRPELGGCSVPFDNNNNFIKALRFGDKSLKEELKGYVGTIQQRNEIARKDGIYDTAVSLKKECDGLENEPRYYRTVYENYNTIISNLEQIQGWKDSDDLIAEVAKKRDKVQPYVGELDRKEEYTRAFSKKTQKTQTLGIVLFALGFIILIRLSWDPWLLIIGAAIAMAGCVLVLVSSIRAAKVQRIMNEPFVSSVTEASSKTNEDDSNKCYNAHPVIKTVKLIEGSSPKAAIHYGKETDRVDIANSSCLSMKIFLTEGIGYSGTANVKFVVFNEYNKTISTLSDRVTVRPGYSVFYNTLILKGEDGSKMDPGRYYVECRVNDSKVFKKEFDIVDSLLQEEII